MANTHATGFTDQGLFCEGTAPGRQGHGRVPAAAAPVRATAEGGKYAGKRVHLSGMPKILENWEMAVGQICRQL